QRLSGCCCSKPAGPSSNIRRPVPNGVAEQVKRTEVPGAGSGLLQGGEGYARSQRKINHLPGPAAERTAPLASRGHFLSTPGTPAVGRDRVAAKRHVRSRSYRASARAAARYPPPACPLAERGRSRAPAAPRGRLAAAPGALHRRDQLDGASEAHLAFVPTLVAGRCPVLGAPQLPAPARLPRGPACRRAAAPARRRRQSRHSRRGI